MSAGIVYVATGKKYFEEASLSASSVKRWMPGVPITVFTDQPDASACFDTIVQVTSCGDGFKDKVMFMAQSPYDRSLFLDTDTFLCGSIQELFDLLQHFDLAMAHDHLVRQVHPMEGVPICFPEFNSGVLLFRKSSEVGAFFDDWLRRYDQDKLKHTASFYHDQPALRQAAYFCNLRIATLTPEYNCMIRYAGSVSGKVMILHCARIGYGWYKRENIEHVARTINSVHKARVFMDGRLYAFLRTPKTPLSKLNPFAAMYTNQFMGWLFPPDWVRRLQRILPFVRSRGVAGSVAHVARRVLVQKAR